MSKDKQSVSRRSFVKFAGFASAGVASAFGAPAASQIVNKQNPSSNSKSKVALKPLPAQYREYTYFTPEEAKFMEAAVDRLIPSDDVGPGALELGVVYYIDRNLESIYGYGAKTYLSGPFQQGESTQGYQLPLRPREIYRLGIANVDSYCRSNYQGKSFAELSESDRDKVLTGLEKGEITLAKVPAGVFFPVLLQNTTEGYFGDPVHGGNREMGSWKMLGFPGAMADFRDDVGKTEKLTYEPISLAQILERKGIQ